MYRVITKNRDRSGGICVERGPWHPTRHEAEYWAEELRHLGYRVEIEGSGTDFGGSAGGNDHDDLASALASMA